MTTRSNVNKLKIICICIFAVYFKLFYLIPFPGSFASNTNILLPTFVAIIGFIIYFWNNKINWSEYAFSPFFVYWIFLLLVEILFTGFYYTHEPIINAIKESVPYLLIFSYFLLSDLARKNMSFLLNMIFIFCNIMVTLILIQSIILKINGHVFLYMDGYTYGVIKNLPRTFGPRLIGVGLLDFAPIISVGLLLSYRKIISNSILVYNIIFTLAYQTFSSQTRSTLYLEVVILFLTGIYVLQHKYKVIRVIIIILGVFTIFFFLNQLIKYITTQLYYQNDWSTYHRVDEMKYYLQRFESSPVFGNGLLQDNPNYIGYFSLVHNLDGLSSYSDVGIIGVMGKLGILGLIGYVWVGVIALKKIIANYNPVNFSLFLGIIGSMVNLSLFDFERLFVLFVFMSLLDGINSAVEKIK